MEAIEQTPEHNILHEYDEELKRKKKTTMAKVIKIYSQNPQENLIKRSLKP